MGHTQGRSAGAMAGDSTFNSDEFREYEREFDKYMGENLRAGQPGQDFMSEFRDEGDALDTKLDCLAAWWKAARRVVIMTGAGASTAAGLPDYRGPTGVWTRKVRGEEASDRIEFDVDGIQPTRTHVALTRLHEAGLVEHVATTNVDGLHRRAGMPADALSELHGNSFVEECEACGRHFERAFHVRTATGLFGHYTGRSCEECGGRLRDILVNFGNTFEHVPSMEAVHDRTWVECLKADLVIVLGSSLSVATACDLPEECLRASEDKPEGGRLVIVNLQRTPKDHLASLQIFAPCDDVLAYVEQNLL